MYDIIPQSTLLTEIRAHMRDSSGTPRWTTVEIYTAMNSALRSWRDKVSIPQRYDLAFDRATYSYTLPSYIQPPFQVMGKNEVVYSPSQYTVLPGTGGWELQFTSLPPRGDGFILWQLRNGNLPTTVPTLQTAINSTDTNIELNSANANLPSAGYVKIDNEFILFNAHTISTRSNLTVAQRGVLSSAAAHSSAASVDFCVALPSGELLTNLINETAIYLHRMMLTNTAAAKDPDYHQQMISYYSDVVEKFWATYTPHTYTARIRARAIDTGMTL